MFDRLGELAALMRDQAEKMLGLGQVRLRFQHTAANRLGIHQPAFGATALHIGERLAERYGVSHRISPVAH
jgi:hypothetical protein